MYYLYHIPGKKIGVTRNLNKRVTEQQGYQPDEYEVLDRSEDISYISKREIELQKSLGYKVDRQTYENLIKSNKMKLNITEQTTTFPMPLTKLKDRLEDAIGMAWETPHGSFKLTRDNYKEVFKNAVTSMYNINRCFIYNKKLVSLSSSAATEANTEPNVFDNIREWARIRGIYTSGDSKTQFTKLVEEVGELAQGILKKDDAEVKDAIGDIIVVLTNLAHLEQMKIEDCVESAYAEIKNRKGTMSNGTFVKQETKKRPWSHQSVKL